MEPGTWNLELKKMLRPFFAAAMVAPARQLTFRRVAVAHVLFLFAVAWLTAASGTSHGLATFGYVLLSLANIRIRYIICSPPIFCS